MFHSGKIMGIVNTTPDSFSDGGDYVEADQAVAHGKQLIEDGASILDVGGQSTRPGYQEVDAAVELQRVLPVIESIRQSSDIPISIDTYFPEVAEAAIQAGASIVNDVKGLDTEGMAEVVARYQVPIVLMHSRTLNRSYSLVENIQRFYEEKVTQCLHHGIGQELICFDPGIGFGKTLEENIQLLKKPKQFRYKQLPLLYGVSRKRTIAGLIGEDDPKKRDFGTIAASLYALEQGVEVVRVHQVKGMQDALKVWQALKE